MLVLEVIGKTIGGAQKEYDRDRNSGVCERARRGDDRFGTWVLVGCSDARRNLNTRSERFATCCSSTAALSTSRSMLDSCEESSNAERASCGGLEGLYVDLITAATVSASFAKVRYS